jgi:small-conductance mechanosensitive channel
MSIFDKLTDEDWRSNEAKCVALATVLSIPTTIAFISLVLAFVFSSQALAFASIVFAYVSFTLAFVIRSVNSKRFLFVGAYLHYRKRMKEELRQSKDGD